MGAPVARFLFSFQGLLELLESFQFKCPIILFLKFFPLCFISGWFITLTTDFGNVATCIFTRGGFRAVRPAPASHSPLPFSASALATSEMRASKRTNRWHGQYRRRRISRIG